MATRRGFLAQLVGAIAATLALPKLLPAAEPEHLSGRALQTIREQQLAHWARGAPTFADGETLPEKWDRLDRGFGCAQILDGGYEARSL